MKNENIFKMKQPALGKRISELRKQQGLTQEELVERCNISVRTIQRIEAGETTPRSFTIKTILEALGVEFDIQNTERTLEEISITSFGKRMLMVAWISGVVYFVVGFFETYVDFYLATEKDLLFSKPYYYIIKMISVMSFGLFFSGFIQLAKLYNKKLLEVVVILFIIINTIFGIYDMWQLQLAEDVLMVNVSVRLITFGILQILFGLALWSLRNRLGTLLLVAAIFEIVIGACFATFVMSMVGLVLLVPATILEIAVLLKVANTKA